MIYLFVYLCINACITLWVQWMLKNDEYTSSLVKEHYNSSDKKEAIDKMFDLKNMELGIFPIVVLFLIGLPLLLTALFSKEKK